MEWWEVRIIISGALTKDLPPLPSQMDYLNAASVNATRLKTKKGHLSCDGARTRETNTTNGSETRGETRQYLETTEAVKDETESGCMIFDEAGDWLGVQSEFES
jgi:hypothetical protein